MTLGTAILLLAVAIICIVLACKCLHNKRALRTVCILLLSLLVLVLACYIGLTLIFVDAVRNQPPVL